MVLKTLPIEFNTGTSSVSSGTTRKLGGYLEGIMIDADQEFDISVRYETFDGPVIFEKKKVSKLRDMVLLRGCATDSKGDKDNFSSPRFPLIGRLFIEVSSSMNTNIRLNIIYEAM